MPIREAPLTNGESQALAAMMLQVPAEEIVSFVLVAVREHGSPVHRCVEVMSDEDDPVMAMGILATAGAKIATAQMEESE